MKPVEWSKVIFGVVVVFTLFQCVATALGSFRGEAGLLVGLVVVIATVKVERLLFTEPVSQAALAVGLGRPTAKGLAVGVVIAASMLGSAVAFAVATGSSLELYPNWPWLAVGIFCQAGIAEETLFRGYLFGHVSQRYSYWKAAALASIPFLLVHMILFYQFPWPIAAASILLSIAISFPLSRLYELNGRTVWAPAIVHFATQAIVKLIVPIGDNAWIYPFFVMAASAVIPLGVYIVRFVRPSLVGPSSNSTARETSQDAEQDSRIPSTNAGLAA